MGLSKVLHDLKVIKGKADVIVVQEFHWPWYWRALQKAMPTTSRRPWRSLPAQPKGLANPVVGGQPVLWNNTIWRMTKSAVSLLHDGAKGISETRMLRAALLRDRTVGWDARVWVGGTHFVVGGDAPGDGPLRSSILASDLDRLNIFLDRLKKTGWPVIFELDANIHRGTEAYARLVKLVRGHGGRFYGAMGVEYLFVIDGEDVAVEVQQDWDVPTSLLYTDHEGRGITFCLVSR